MSWRIVGNLSAQNDGSFTENGVFVADNDGFFTEIDGFHREDIQIAGTKGKSTLIKWMKKELGIKLKNGKLSAKWYGRIKKILGKMAEPPAKDEV